MFCLSPPLTNCVIVREQHAFSYLLVSSPLFLSPFLSLPRHHKTDVTCFTARLHQIIILALSRPASTMWSAVGVGLTGSTLYLTDASTPEATFCTNLVGMTCIGLDKILVAR
jgi:hypothetical protein